MSRRITDDMLDEWAIVASCDDLPASVAQRCAGVYSTVLLDLPPALRSDEDWMTTTIKALQTA